MMEPMSATASVALIWEAAAYSTWRSGDRCPPRYAQNRGLGLGLGLGEGVVVAESGSGVRGRHGSGRIRVWVVAGVRGL